MYFESSFTLAKCYFALESNLQHKERASLYEILCFIFKQRMQFKLNEELFQILW